MNSAKPACVFIVATCALLAFAAQNSHTVNVPSSAANGRPTDVGIAPCVPCSLRSFSAGYRSPFNSLQVVSPVGTKGMIRRISWLAYTSVGQVIVYDDAAGEHELIRLNQNGQAQLEFNIVFENGLSILRTSHDFQVVIEWNAID